MSERTLKTLLGTLAGLVALYGIVALATSGSGGASGESPLADAFAAVDGADVEAVTMIRRGDTLELERVDDGGWTVEGRRAGADRVAALWEALEGVGEAELVATNPANHERMGIADEGDAAAWSVAFRIAGADEPVRLLVGDAGPRTPSAYVRLPAQPEVYLLDGDLRSMVARERNGWRDRRIAAVDTAAVGEVRVTRDGESYALRRTPAADAGADAAAGMEASDGVADDGYGWVVVAADGGASGGGGAIADSGRPADAGAVRDLLGALAALEASGFAPDSVEATDADRRTVIALSVEDDTLTELRMSADEEGSDIRVTVPDRDAVFTLASWQADRLAPERDALLAEEDEEEESDATPSGG
ncbi:MAG: DUF4340 domain-containing protein [Gemmatimonadota bacterium]